MTKAYLPIHINFSSISASAVITVSTLPQAPVCQHKINFTKKWGQTQASHEAHVPTPETTRPKNPPEVTAQQGNKATPNSLTEIVINTSDNSDKARLTIVELRDLWRLRSSFEDELDDDEDEAEDSKDSIEIAEDVSDCVSSAKRGQLRLLQRDSGYRSVERRSCLQASATDGDGVFEDETCEGDGSDEAFGPEESFSGVFYGCHENPLVARFLRSQVSASAASLSGSGGSGSAASSEARRHRLRRDYSIDERSSALFNQFLKPPACGLLRRHESERGLRHQQPKQKRAPLKLSRCSAKDSIDEEEAAPAILTAVKRQ
uniref:Protein TSSC4 n=1 Tax=Macrostomum lignano TaxID=282301 RepID=A0A1I8GK42_9PLAT